MKRAAKGSLGYIRYEKVKRAIIMAIMFAIPIAIYYTAYRVTGSNRNIMTIVAIVGIIPAAKFAVSFIMIMMQKDAPEEIASKTGEIAGELVHGYELTVTAYEGRMPLDAIVICGNEIACFSSRGDKSQFQFMEKHIKKILNSNNYFDTNVKIFDSDKHYFDRIKALASDPEKYRAGIKFSGDERYPELTREECIFHTIMAISL